ncbi:hypothetical protein [Priestia megaterium]|uniref:hypothetical protein n=1 Tax=Priestia megaterium TaxID=1404 RepID=UPI001A954004|nr:hypothetical protein [Priestia megaterium]QSX23392.1 hypothetical protein J0P05_26795 [Priestia megaterium]
MKKITLITLITSILLFVSNSIEAKALAFPELPTTETSKQWTVEVSNPDNDDPDLAQAKRGVYHTYSLNVKNVGKDVHDVKVQLFRNEPNSNTKYGLLPTMESPQLNQKGGHPLHVSNFGISEEATDLNIVITWKEQGEERIYQETFTFHQK